MGFHLNRLTLRIRLLTANDPAAAYSTIVSFVALSGGIHARGVYGLGTWTVDIAQMRKKVRNVKRFICLW